jgi:peptidoglycan/LPS O-acetylase OafA/YrhL
MPSPLHPAIVHFPIVFTFLLPLAALVALWRIRRGGAPRPAWLVPVACAGALAASAWLAVETGERDEDRAEDIVGESTLGAHEAAAERFLALSAGVLLIAAAGLLRGPVGRLARPTAVIASVGLVAAGYQVGHTGGRIVYGTAGAPGVGGIAATGSEGDRTEGRAAEPDRSGERDRDSDD